MTPEMRARLARVFPALESPVTGEHGVTGGPLLRHEALELRQLRQLRLENDKKGKRSEGATTTPASVPLDDETDAIAERAALLSEQCPTIYVDTFARLNHQKPLAVSEAEWRRAIDDAGRFLDSWGALAAEMEWTAGELFDVPREGRAGGLVWRMKGERVEALGADHARLADGRVLDFATSRGRDGAQ